MQFTGTLNGGISGGPAVNSRGDVVGVNVSRRVDAEQQSFLVPAGRVIDLQLELEEAEWKGNVSSGEIRSQLWAFQAKLAEQALQKPADLKRFGPYTAPDFGSALLHCRPTGSGSNADKPEPMQSIGRKCSMQR